MTDAQISQEGTFAGARHTDVTSHRAVIGECGHVQDILSRVGDKWTMLVVMELETGALRCGSTRSSAGSAEFRSEC